MEAEKFLDEIKKHFDKEVKEKQASYYKPNEAL